MEPIRIKHWGFWPITKRGYLFSQGCVAAAWFVLLAVYARLPHPLPPLRDEVGGAVRFGWTLLEWIPTVLIVVAVWFILDVTITLRCFARKEAMQQTKPTP